MKKIVIATLLATMAATAGALEIGLAGGSDIKVGDHTSDIVGLTVGTHFGSYSVTGEADREFNGNVNKFSLIGGYDFAKFGNATFTAKAGASYLDALPVKPSDRYAALIGAGVSVPVTKEVGMTVDYHYTFDNNSAKSYKGNTVMVGAKYSF